MKKILMSFCLLALATFAKAQHVQFGLKGGINLSTIKDSRAPNSAEYRNGFHFGALTHIHLGPRFALQPEAVYSIQGARYTTAGERGTSKYYNINIPVLLQYMFKYGFRAEVGPQLGIRTKAQFRPEGSNGDIDISNLNTTDFSLVAGIGYLTPTGLGVDVRYNHGISNLYEAGPATAYHRFWQAGLFFQFGMKK